VVPREGPGGHIGVASWWWCLALALALIAPGAPPGSAPPVGPIVGVSPISTPGAASLTANATALDVGGSWNCGQGGETFDLFGQANAGVAPYQYLWSFGDGTPPSAAQDPVHTYHNLLEFTANLTVTDATHETARTQVTGHWGVPQTCTAAPSTNWAGIALYVLLVAGVATAIILLTRRQRQRPLP